MSNYKMPDGTEIMRRLLGVADLPGAINDRFYPEIADSCAGRTITANEFVMIWCAAILNLEGLVIPEFTTSLMLDFPIYVRALVDDQEMAEETINHLKSLSARASTRR